MACEFPWQVGSHLEPRVDLCAVQHFATFIIDRIEISHVCNASAFSAVPADQYLAIGASSAHLMDPGWCPISRWMHKVQSVNRL